MKKFLAVFAVAVFLFGCNMNPSKESRIQKLETEIELATDKIKEMEKRLDSIETAQKRLELKASDH